MDNVSSRTHICVACAACRTFLTWFDMSHCFHCGKKIVTPKKIMISLGMRDKENLEDYVESCRKAVQKHYTDWHTPIEILDTFFSDFGGNRLQFLAKSISDGLAMADEVVFMDDWHIYDGCLAEHFIATRYGIPCMYLHT